MAYDFDVAIVGGGAAGCYAAAVLTASSKLKVAVIERNDRLGKKLSVTGNGQGNISNERVSEECYMSVDGRSSSNGLSVLKGISRFSPAEVLRCPLTKSEDGRIYPMSRQASSVTDILRKAIEKRATVILGEKVERISPGYALSFSGGGKISAEFVILACGGRAQPRLGSDGFGYSLAKSLGHSVTSVYPSLVQLKTPQSEIKGLKGVRMDATVTAFEGSDKLADSKGEVIFQDYGITGNAVFAVSPYVTARSGVTLKVDLLPEVNETDLANYLKRRESDYPVKREIFAGILPNRMGRTVIDGMQKYDALLAARLAKNYRLTVTGNLGFDSAQVTRGGIRMNEIDERFESALSPKLFLVGEMLDIDGPCGGYNLHLAFYSGDQAARRILNYDKT